VVRQVVLDGRPGSVLPLVASLDDRDPTRAVDHVQQVLGLRRLCGLLPTGVLEDAVDVGGAVADPGSAGAHPLLHALSVGTVEVAGLDRG
jgi:hypothetical protein